MDIASLVSLVFALFSIFVGLLIIRRLAGKLRNAVIAIILAIVIIATRETLILLEINVAPIFVAASRILAVLLLLIAMLSIKSIIDGINGRYKK